MSKQILAIGNTGTQLVSKFNSNFSELYALRASIFNVEDYGALHDGATDDTEAIQDTINAAFANGGGTIYFPAGHYMIKGALVTTEEDDSPNSQLYIPVTDESSDLPKTIPQLKFLGEYKPPLFHSGYWNPPDIFYTNSVILESTLDAGTGTIPAMIGSGHGAYEQFDMNFTSCEFVNMTFLTIYDTITAINGKYIDKVEFEHCVIDITTSVYEEIITPANESAGVIIAGVRSYGLHCVRHLSINGYKYGLVIGEQHIIESVYVTGCKYGVVPVSNWYAGIANALFVEGCYTAILFPNAEIFGITPDDICVFNVNNLQIEQYGRDWFYSTNLVEDEGNKARGTLKFTWTHGTPSWPSYNDSPTIIGATYYDCISSLLKYQKWDTAGRPSPTYVGRTGWNTTTGKVEVWDGSNWNALW